jgi:hypothetical protein
MDIVSQNAEPAGVASAGKNTEEGARTLDLWIHNPVLYQLSYLGIRNLNILFYDTQTLKQRPRRRRRFADQTTVPRRVAVAPCAVRRVARPKHENTSTNARKPANARLSVLKLVNMARLS